MQEKLKHLENDAYSAFNSAFTNLLNEHAPLKTKILRFDNKTFITKELRKKIMKRSKLNNLFNKNKNQENWCKYKTQRNYYVNLLCKTKKQYYKNLDIKEVTDNKKFWKSVKSYFGKGDSNSEKIMLLENNSIKTNEKEIAIIMNDYFINITKNLDLKFSKKMYC